MGGKSRKKKEVRAVKEFREAHSSELIQVKSSIPGAKQFAMGECTIFIAKEQVGKDLPVIHVQVSCRSRKPTWDEVIRARFLLLQEGMDVAIFLPKKKSEIKSSGNTIHLWQVNFVTKDPAPGQKEG